MGVKDFFQRKAIERQLKNLPEGQREIFQKMFEKNPDLFEKIAKEIKEKKDQGQDELLASATVMKKYENEMRKIISSLN